jgi:hypothetical protein
MKLRRVLYPLLMVVVALIGAASIIGYAYCDKHGGCMLVTGEDLKEAVTEAVIHGANIGYSVGQAGCDKTF